MPSELDKLLDICGPSLCPLPPNFEELLDHIGGSHSDGFRDIYRMRNGFYAFESSLHVFPVQSCGETVGLDEWNSIEGWRRGYGESVYGCTFFGEDVFGTQFCIKNNEVLSFDPETSAFTYMAENLYGWAKVLLDDYEFLTGYPLGHEWQKLFGPLPPGMRLVAKIPFVLGGEYSVDNLKAMTNGEAMKFRAEIAVQIQNLPDGEKARLRIVDE